MTKLNPLPFNAILSFEKRRKSHCTKHGEYGECGMSHFVFSQKFIHRQSRWETNLASSSDFLSSCSGLKEICHQLHG